MRQHALFGLNILKLSNSALMKLATEIALSHYERWDGSGRQFEPAIVYLLLNNLDAFTALRLQFPNDMDAVPYSTTPRITLSQTRAHGGVAQRQTQLLLHAGIHHPA